MHIAIRSNTDLLRESRSSRYSRRKILASGEFSRLGLTRAREAWRIKKSKFTEQQIAFALQQAEGGTQVSEVCRKMGISEATFYRWKQLYGGLLPSGVKKLRQLEEEDARPAQSGGTRLRGTPMPSGRLVTRHQRTTLPPATAPKTKAAVSTGSNASRRAIGLPTNLWRAEMVRRKFIVGLEARRRGRWRRWRSSRHCP
jgi:putative transposase